MSKRLTVERQDYDLRERKSYVFYEGRLTPDFIAFANEEVLPLLNLDGYKLAAKQEIARHVIHNLITTGVAGNCVSDSRDDSVRFRRGVWDAVTDAGLARVCLGSQESRKVTRYLAKAKLLDLRRQWELWLLIDVHLARNTERENPTPYALVLLHTGRLNLVTGEPLPDEQQKQPIAFLRHIERYAQRSNGRPDPAAVQNGLDYFRGLEDCLERINRSNLAHSWQAFTTDSETGRKHVFQPNPCLRQIHVGELFRAVRLYSWSQLSGQNLSKQVRKSMLIDEQSVAELDFSGMATRMLYHRAGHDPKGDVYKPEVVLPKSRGLSNAERHVLRDFVKRATNICWNVGKRSNANSSVGKLITEHDEAEFVRKVIFTVERTDAAGIVDRIMEAHAILRDHFFTEVGLELMTTDGKIMLNILNEFADAGKPALGIHDAVVCKESDADFALETMRESYRQFMQFDPVINRVY